MMIIKKINEWPGGLTLVFVFILRLKFEFHSNKSILFKALDLTGIKISHNQGSCKMEHSFRLIMSADTLSVA